ncbi:hypothetical protein [Xanthomonas citri]|uniref:hypothetical protein n=1 Tax=Xanthomonas citri TaxID=346 RepID=UPI00037C8DF3|nr:hypothetical protein [Xanthomonas citri]ARV22563.1 hypothetical protein A9D66_08110 [Xanthomonas citri pv. glycines str. 12-2]
MPVSPDNAYRLLNTFGMVEFTLKQRQGFLAAGGDPREPKRAKAKANWDAVDLAVRHLPHEDFVGRVSPATVRKILGDARNRPQVQFVRKNADGSWHANFEDSPLPADEAEALVVAMRRVRNNLFHGGKEDPLEERHPNDDNEWAAAAAEIAELLLDLLDRQILRPRAAS